MPAEQLKTLKVYELEPGHKHPVIFECFDQLQRGDSFIIENDHDPLPLYYQLKAERVNELGKFEYLQEGPGVWIVRITKSQEPGRDAATERSAQSCNISPGKQETTNSRKENRLDVTRLEPRLKHPTIFYWFNSLEPGESFTLINDHDPKPLYYQMLGELGPVFNWQYIEQGPEWWKVVIQKKETTATVGEIAAKDDRKAKAMTKLGIDFCCGGKRTVNEAAKAVGITPEELNTALAEAGKLEPGTTQRFDKWDADFLIDYIYRQHHQYFYEEKDGLSQLSVKVKEVHGQHHPELRELADLVDKLFNDLQTHFHKEEAVLFPYIKELVAYKKQGVQPANAISISQGPLTMMHMEHEAAGEILKAMRNVTHDYQVPDHACSSFRQLYNRLEELEADLHQHIHLENNILFPKALQLEKEFVS